MKVEIVEELKLDEGDRRKKCETSITGADSGSQPQSHDIVYGRF
jgi:hypothetical protein